MSKLRELRAGLDRAAAGAEMHALASELYPLCRSITGDGLRATLARVGREVPLEVREVPTGTRVFDWTVPPEWNVREAWIAAPDGRRVVDFAHHTLHLVSYSRPVRARLTRDELLPHLHSLREQPELIPYRTSYYADAWGFCLAHRTLEALGDGPFEVCVDATLADGSLTYGELLVPGSSEEEVLLSAHACHPSLANDNLSGIVVVVALARRLARASLRRSYRFVLAPGTIGAITWLAANEDRLERIVAGLVLTCLGDPGAMHYKRSRHGHALVDRAAEHVLGHEAPGSALEDFSPEGYDERQYGSPGIDLAVGRLTRSPGGSFPEYHTSADDLGFIRPEHLADSLDKLLAIVEILEEDRRLVSRAPKGEPQLGRRGLYGAVGGVQHRAEGHRAMLWALNLADGEHGLLEVAERSGLPFGLVAEAAGLAEARGLLREAPRP